MADSEINDPKVYGTNQVNAIFLNGNPEFLKDKRTDGQTIPDVLAGLGVAAEDWQAGRMRVAVTCYPGKYMPPRSEKAAWKGHRTLMAQSDYEARKKAEVALTEIKEKALQAWDWVLGNHLDAVLDYFVAGSLLPPEYQEEVRARVAMLRQIEPTKVNQRKIETAQMNIVATVEAALIKMAGLKMEEVSAGLLMPSVTPTIYKQLPDANLVYWIPVR